ncbi:MAG: hypothetical protein U0903_15855 [Planctomycetales bacterium]
MKKLLQSSLVLAAVVPFLGMEIQGVRAADGDKKHTIAQIMDLAHKKRKGEPSLLNEVKSGKATDEQKQELDRLYEEMATYKAPHGDQAHWEKLNKELVQAAKQVAEGKEGAIKELNKAANCRECHSAHQGKKSL